MSDEKTPEQTTTGHQITPVVLRQISDDASLLEIGRKAIEDTLIEWRDARLSLSQRNNGLVIREPDGTDSSIIRLGSEDALRIGMRAIADHLAVTPVPQS